VGVLAVGLTAWFSDQQAERQRKLEAKRDKSAQAIAKQQREYTAVQEYMDKMTALILSDREGGLRSSKETSDLRKLARARSLTVLDILSGERKRAAVTFLYEARLLETPKPIVDISGAALQDAQLQFNPYVGVDLRGTFLSDGPDKDHKGALLYDCDLRDANLRYADLGDADLKRAYLNDGPDEDKDGAVLIHAVLIRADLHAADLCAADLRDANLSKAMLYGAELSGADLSGATGWTEERLTAAKSLEGTMMPDGQTLKSADNPDWPTFEEWLKSRGEDK
jgi:uncharacterized protein YjbI with pentapeptide repeats